MAVQPPPHVDSGHQQWVTGQGPSPEYKHMHQASNSHKPGKCAFRELNSGVECGCQHFWRQDVNGIPQCACGHHTCYHVTVATQNRTNEPVKPAGTGFIGQTQNVTVALLDQLSQIRRLLAGVPCSSAAPAVPECANPLLGLETATPIEVAQLPDLNPTGPSTLSRASTSYLPRLPVGCATIPYDSQEQAKGLQRRQPSSQPSIVPGPSNGLNLWLNDVVSALASGKNQSSRPSQDLTGQSNEQIIQTLDIFKGVDLASLANPPYTAAACQHVLTPIHQSQRPCSPTPQVTDFTSLRNIADMLQSATEIATPTTATTTPDLNIPGATIHGTIGTPQQSIAQSPPRYMPHLSLSHKADTTLHITADHPASSSSSQAKSPPSLPQEAQTIQAISSHLHTLGRFLASQHDRLRGLLDRLEAVERRSFSQLPCDQDIFDKLEMMETRIIEIEGKLDDAQLNGLVGSGLSSNNDSVNTRRTHYQQDSSIASNPLIITCNQLSRPDARGDHICTNAIEERINHLEGRLHDLEHVLPPCLARPLQLEVVLLPWGRKLKGLWVPYRSTSQHEQPTNMTTQQSEDWSHCRDLHPFFKVPTSPGIANEQHSWTDRTTHDHTNRINEWLVPRACGPKSVAYHRLKSRGFVKSIQMTSSSTKEILDLIEQSFGEILSVVESGSPSTCAMRNVSKDQDSVLFGLDAAFVPLRKVRHCSKLQFLADSELVIPTLWSSQFLLSSIIMHGSRGKKRLYITYKQAYLQKSDAHSTSWTWQKIRQLPTFSSPSGTEEEKHVTEWCWNEHLVLDAPSSFTASFSSRISRSSSCYSSGSNELPSIEQHCEPEQVAEGQGSDILEAEFESQSGFESEAIAIADNHKAEIPITPVTEHDNISSQDVYRLAQKHSCDTDIWGTTHSQSKSTQASGSQKVNHSLGSNNSNSARLARKLNSAQLKEMVGKSERGLRSFSTPFNPLITSLPNYILLPSKDPRRKSSRRLMAEVQSSTLMKRRRIERSVSAEAYMSNTRCRRSRSTSLLTRPSDGPQIASGSRRQGKRPRTPAGPYMTPYSGNFASGFSDDYASSIRTLARAESDEWEGAGNDQSETEQCKLYTTVDALKLTTDDLMMDDDSDHNTDGEKETEEEKE